MPSTDIQKELYMKQKDIFLKSEGNSYYSRNPNPHLPQSTTQALQIFGRNVKRPGRVLEIGCADGRNLWWLNQTFEFECHGIDPSIDAIEAGKTRFPAVQLNLGTADKLPFGDSDPKARDVFVFGCGSP